jgi:hypothetical protein
MDPAHPDHSTVPYVIQHLINEESRHVANHVNYAANQLNAKQRGGQKLMCYCCEEGHYKNECDMTPHDHHCKDQKDYPKEAQVKVAFADKDVL